MKDTIIFDLDGTLLDTLADLKNSVNYAMRSYGYPERTWEDVRKFVGNGIRVLIHLALPGGRENPDYEAVFACFKEHYGLHCNENTKPYPGIMELIGTLRKHNIKMAIVSNKADFAVKELNHIYFGEDISIAIGENEDAGIRKKPAPDTVLEALKQLNRTREEAYYVGDSEVDIKTAANCGMDAIICTWGFRDEDYLQEMGAGCIIHSPEEIIAILGLE